MRLPLTLRLVYHAARAGSLALIFMIAGWLLLVPASPSERQALGAQFGDDSPVGLTQMRIARAMVHFAPDYAARRLSRASGGTISPELAGMLLRDVAKGPAARNAAFESVTQPEAAAPLSQQRRTSGAKFVTAPPKRVAPSHLP